MTTENDEWIEFVVRNLRAAMPRNWPEIAKQTGVPEKTIYKIAYRQTKDPRTSTTEALYDYFVAQQRIHERRDRRISRIKT